MGKFTKAIAEALRQCPELHGKDLSALKTPHVLTELGVEFILTGRIDPGVLRSLVEHTAEGLP